MLYFYKFAGMKLFWGGISTKMKNLLGILQIAFCNLSNVLFLRTRLLLCTNKAIEHKSKIDLCSIAICLQQFLT